MKLRVSGGAEVMERMTHMRCNGIKSGYWSPEKKENLVQIKYDQGGH